MKIISYNIQYGKGMDGVIDLNRTCSAIRGADIICLQEVEQRWRRSGERDQPAEIAGLMPSYYYVYGSSFDVDASSRAAHGAVINRRRRHGNMILSRWPILGSRTFNLPKQHYNDRFNMQMTFVEAVIDTGSTAIRVYSYHAGYLLAGERLGQVNEFVKVFTSSPTQQGAWSGKPDIDNDDWSNQQESPGLPRSAIVCGDFNASPDTGEYRRLLDGAGLVDCWAVSDPANQRTSTLIKEPAEDIRITGKVDHIFVTPELSGCIERLAIDQDADASDHRPVQVILDLSR